MEKIVSSMIFAPADQLRPLSIKHILTEVEVENKATFLRGGDVDWIEEW